MSIAESAFVTQLKALLPPGKAWSRSAHSLIDPVMRGIAPEFARIQGRGDQLVREMNPGTAVELLPEHENTNGVTPPTGATVAQRQAALLAKLQETAGHNPGDYAAFAAALGHPGLRVTRMPMPPLRMGGRVGGPARGEFWAHAYFVAYMTQRLTAQANDFGAWQNPSSAAILTNAVAAPDGSNSAESISLIQTGNPQTLACPLSAPSSSTQFSVWLRSFLGPVSMQLEVRNTGSGQSSSTTFLVTQSWARYQIQASVSAANQVSIIKPSSAPLSLLYAWGAYAGSRDPAFEASFMNRQQAHGAPIFRVIGDERKD